MCWIQLHTSSLQRILHACCFRLPNCTLLIEPDLWPKPCPLSNVRISAIQNEYAVTSMRVTSTLKSSLAPLRQSRVTRSYVYGQGGFIGPIQVMWWWQQHVIVFAILPGLGVCLGLLHGKKEFWKFCVPFLTPISTFTEAICHDENRQYSSSLHIIYSYRLSPCKLPLSSTELEREVFEREVR